MKPNLQELSLREVKQEHKKLSTECAIETIIFDLGGTLIEYAGPYDAWPDLETPGFQAAYQFLQQQGVALPAFEPFRDTGFALLPGRWRQATTGIQNLRVADLLRETLHAFGLKHVEEAWLMEAAVRYQAAICSQATLIEGAQEVLAYASAQGYKVGLLSNTMFEGDTHQEDLRRFGLINYFDAMLFSADVNKWKPNAAPFLHLLDQLQASPATAVYIGDDPASDVVGGQRAGLCTIHYRSPSNRFHNPQNIHPDAEIRDLEELPNLLSRWNNSQPPV